MAITKNDFIEIEYTGRTADDKAVFDTTDESVAKESKIFYETAKYGPAIICIGQSHTLKGIENFLEGKEPGKFSIDIKADDAFGKKSAKLLKLVPVKVFAKEKIAPYPGLDVELDGSRGVVRSVSGGRVIVDFNHPLASRDLHYDIEVKRIVSDTVEKVKAVFKLELNFTDLEVSFDEKTGVVKIVSALPAVLNEGLEKRLQQMIPEIKKADFEQKKEKASVEEIAKDNS